MPFTQNIFRRPIPETSWLFLTFGCGYPYDFFFRKFCLNPLTALLGYQVQKYFLIFCFDKKIFLQTNIFYHISKCCQIWSRHIKERRLWIRPTLTTIYLTNSRNILETSRLPLWFQLFAYNNNIKKWKTVYRDTQDMKLSMHKQDLSKGEIADQK